MLLINFNVNWVDSLVSMISDNAQLRIGFEYLEPIMPSSGHHVKVVSGKPRDTVGVLVSIDYQEGVVRIDSQNVRMYFLQFLSKMYNPSFCKGTKKELELSLVLKFKIKKLELYSTFVPNYKSISSS